MADVLEVNADLMLATGDRSHAQPREFFIITFELPLRPVARLRRVTIIAHAIFHRHFTGVVSTERGIDGAFAFRHVTVHDGPVLFLHLAAFPQFAELTRHFICFAHAHHAASFAIQPIDQMHRLLRAAIQSQPPRQARPLIALRGMANESRRFVNDQQVIVLV